MKVSIVIPAYNRSQLLKRAIESVLKQNLTDWELIIVDDGSTDDTAKMAGSYAARDARIKCIRESNSGGPARPLNAGIKEAHGGFLAFLEQDDEWREDKLAKQTALLESRLDLGIVGSFALVVNDDTGRRKMVSLSPRKDSEGWLNAMLENDHFFFNLSTLMVRRSSYPEGVSFDESMKVSADLDFYVRMMPAGFDVVREPLVVYHSNSSSLSKGSDSASTIVADMEYALEKHASLFSGNPKARAKLLGYVGTMSFLAGDRRGACSYFVESLKIYPGNLRLYLKMLLLYCFGVRAYSRLKSAYFGYLKIR